MYTLLLGVSYELKGTTGDTVTDMNWSSSVLPGGTVNLIYLIHYLIVCLLLLLSGDVELNPGPTIDDQPSCLLFAKYLKPLADWKPFALCLPGITQSHVNIIDRNAHHNKIATLYIRTGYKLILAHHGEMSLLLWRHVMRIKLLKL